MLYPTANVMDILWSKYPTLLSPECCDIKFLISVGGDSYFSLLFILMELETWKLVADIPGWCYSIMKQIRYLWFGCLFHISN